MLLSENSEMCKFLCVPQVLFNMVPRNSRRTNLGLKLDRRYTASSHTRMQQCVGARQEPPGMLIFAAAEQHRSMLQTR